LVSLFDKTGKKVHFYAAVPWAKLILWSCGIKVTVMGNENIDPKLSRIYMTNHQSYFDIFALLAYVPVHFKFLLKKELMRIPLFGLAMRKAGYIGIDRDDPKEAILSIRKAGEKLRGGASLVVFPEGTRSVDGRLLPFKRGAFNLAIRSGRDIVPLAIINSYLIVPKGRLKINRGGFRLAIGKPVRTEGYTKKDILKLMDKVSESIKGLLEKNAGDENIVGQQQTQNGVFQRGG